MVNLIKVAKGMSLFLAGFFIMILLSWIIPVMISALSIVYSSNDLAGIVWAFTIIVWVAMTLIIPNIYILEGIKETNTDMHPMLHVLISILIFITGVFLSVKGWYFIQGLASIAQNEFTLALYWIAVTIIWFEVIIGIPAFTIMEALKENQ